MDCRGGTAHRRHGPAGPTASDLPASPGRSAPSLSSPRWRAQLPAARWPQRTTGARAFASSAQARASSCRPWSAYSAAKIEPPPPGIRVQLHRLPAGVEGFVLQPQTVQHGRMASGPESAQRVVLDHPRRLVPRLVDPPDGKQVRRKNPANRRCGAARAHRPAKPAAGFLLVRCGPDRPRCQSSRALPAGPDRCRARAAQAPGLGHRFTGRVTPTMDWAR